VPDGARAPAASASAPDLEASSLESPLSFYGFAENPFSLSTDPKFLYHSSAHDRTAQALLTSIGQREGITVITGPLGIGKTSLCRAVIEELDRHTLTSFLVDPFLSVEDLLETLLIDFGVLSRDDLAPGSHPSTHQLRVTLQSFLRSLTSLQANAVVLIDEAQNLPVSVLEELRTMVEAGDTPRLLHVVLVGDPELLSLLKRRELRPLSERVAMRSALGPLTADELSGYVMHRTNVSGQSRLEFADAALARIYELTRGVPRVVNALCERALVRACEELASVIDVRVVDKAAADLGLSAPVTRRSPALRLLVAVAAFVVLMLLGAIAAMWVFRDDLHRAVVEWERVPPAPGGPRLPRAEPLPIPRR
jgi:general secretion pathway protein A